MQLRYLQTMVEMSDDQSSTIVMPFPMELGKMLEGFTGRKMS